MAVQAQYPSNLFLLNRNTQEGKNEYSLQKQSGGGGGGASSSALYDHQPHLVFSSAVENNNTRKRSREFMALQQSQQSNQIIDLSQLHTLQNHPNNVVSTGLRLAFGDQFHQQKQQHTPHHHQTQQQQQQHLSLLSSKSSQKSSLLSPLSDDLASHIKQQREEIDNFIKFQGEQLQRGLAEKRRRSFRALLSASEGTVSTRLREKEAEVERAFTLHAELEARAVQLSSEVQAWQARAREQEVTAAALQAELQQVMENGRGGGGEKEDAESVFIDPDRVTELTRPSCKACGERVASMVLLPCRHLCLCTECDTVARGCPLCYTFRNSSVQVILA